MNVADLIALLNDLPPDAPVVHLGRDDMACPILSIPDVCLDDGRVVLSGDWSPMNY